MPRPQASGALELSIQTSRFDSTTELPPVKLWPKFQLPSTGHVTWKGSVDQASR